MVNLICVLKNKNLNQIKIFLLSEIKLRVVYFVRYRFKFPNIKYCKMNLDLIPRVNLKDENIQTHLHSQRPKNLSNVWVQTTSTLSTAQTT
jgi:hypothetical protein